MNLEKFIKDFEEAFETVEPGSLLAETKYRDLNSWDSLAVLAITDIVEMEYGVLLNKKDFEDANTIGELYDCIIQKQ